MKRERRRGDGAWLLAEGRIPPPVATWTLLSSFHGGFSLKKPLNGATNGWTAAASKGRGGRGAKEGNKSAEEKKKKKEKKRFVGDLSLNKRVTGARVIITIIKRLVDAAC